MFLIVLSAFVLISALTGTHEDGGRGMRRAADRSA
jgi:hypothetical protein